MCGYYENGTTFAVVDESSVCHLTLNNNTYTRDYCKYVTAATIGTTFLYFTWPEDADGNLITLSYAPPNIVLNGQTFTRITDVPKMSELQDAVMNGSYNT